jgi:nucleotide-binding universal stress UspA family protein
MSDMPSHILAVLGQPRAATAVLGAAGDLALLLGAAVEALVVRCPPEATILPTEEILTEAERAALEAGERQRIASLRGLFDAWVARTGGPAAAWAETEGDAGGIVAERGRRSDLLVLERPVRRDRLPGRETLHTALFATSRPVLLVPADSPDALGRRVAIAWKDDRRAVKAVLAAMPVLERAERVSVLAGVREGAPPPVLPPVLAEHGVSAEVHTLTLGPRGTFGAALLAAAHGLGADLLVMGAYAHSPLSELILGGVTRHVLAETDIPVLMRH